MTTPEHIGENLKLERRIALILFGALLLFMSVLTQFGANTPAAPAVNATTEAAE